MRGNTPIDLEVVGRSSKGEDWLGLDTHLVVRIELNGAHVPPGFETSCFDAS